MLPGGSEAVLFAVIRLHPEQALPALVLATLGNTLGGMTTYGMGRLLPQHLAPEKSALARRRGPPILLLAWTPIVGDALCAAAGWLRLPWLPCASWMALGKAARYALVVAGAGML
ncbi:MAG: DedA family protein [Sulfuritalea sp.]|nr:DedA family protein [Sulfuritalea sp.]